jgi:hypothetical protein
MTLSLSLASVLAFAALALCKPYAGRYQAASKGKDNHYPNMRIRRVAHYPIPSRHCPDVRVELG